MIRGTGIDVEVEIEEPEIEEQGIDTLEMTDEHRGSREIQTWDADNIRDEDLEQFNPGETLADDALAARPGMVQRWIRIVDFSGEPDRKNISKVYNQGWRPRPASSVPRSVAVSTIDMRGVDTIGTEGMVLMERPERLHEKAQELVREDTRRQAQSVKHTLHREAAPQPSAGFHAPKVEDKSAVSIAKPAPVADD